MPTVGIISTGGIGCTVGLSLQSIGYKTIFASKGRSKKTNNQALQCGFVDVGTYSELAKWSDIVICVGTNQIWMEAIDEMFVKNKFSGIYLDLNSLHSNNDEVAWRELVTKHSQGNYCEGAFRGYPSYPNIPNPKSHLMILSGPQAHEAFGIFSQTPMHIQYSGSSAKTVNRLMSSDCGITKVL